LADKHGGKQPQGGREPEVLGVRPGPNVPVAPGPQAQAEGTGSATPNGQSAQQKLFLKFWHGVELRRLWPLPLGADRAIYCETPPTRNLTWIG
jgi:hypothetical protein